MPTAKKKILVVDDEKPLAKVLSAKLNKEGYETQTANNGLEVMEILKNNKFDLILLDLIMPRMDGFKVLTELKLKKNTTPVIVTSNLSSEEDKKEALALGAVDFLIKSNTSMSKIIEIIRQKL